MPASMRLISHPAYVSARREFVRAIDRAQPGSIVFLVGMPGAGKTELRIDVMNELAGDISLWGLGRTPILGLRAAPTDRAFFSPKDFQARLRNELRAPVMDWYRPKDKAAAKSFEAFKKEIGEAHVFWEEQRRTESENAMRRQFEDGARARCIKYLFVEQGGSLVRTQRGHEPHDQMYSLMCEAEEIPLVLIMVGTHRMAALWQGDPEIRRRSQRILFPRYKNSDADLYLLLRLCTNVTRNLQFACDATPAETIKLVYYATCGVFDELRTFYERAESVRENEGVPAITLDHLKSAVLPPKDFEGLYLACANFDALEGSADLSTMLKLGESEGAAK